MAYNKEKPEFNSPIIFLSLLVSLNGIFLLVKTVLKLNFLFRFFFLF
jgi:hypothetical protein